MAGARTQGAGRGVNWGAYGNIVSALLEGGRAQAQGIAQFGAGIGGAIGNYRQEKRQDAAAKAEADYRAQRDATEQARWEAQFGLQKEKHGLDIAQMDLSRQNIMADNQRQEASFRFNIIKAQLDALQTRDNEIEANAQMEALAAPDPDSAQQVIQAAMSEKQRTQTGRAALEAQLRALLPAQPGQPSPQPAPQPGIPEAPARQVNTGYLEQNAQNDFQTRLNTAKAGWQGDYGQMEQAAAVVKNMDEQIALLRQQAQTSGKGLAGVARMKQAMRTAELLETAKAQMVAGLGAAQDSVRARKERSEGAKNVADSVTRAALMQRAERDQQMQEQEFAARQAERAQPAPTPEQEGEALARKEAAKQKYLEQQGLGKKSEADDKWDTAILKGAEEVDATIGGVRSGTAKPGSVRLDERGPAVAAALILHPKYAGSETAKRAASIFRDEIHKGDARAAAKAAYNALKPAQQTDEALDALLAAFGVK